MLEKKTITNTKNLKVLRELIKAGAVGLSANHAAILSGLSTPSVFRAFDELRELGIVVNVGSMWKLVPGNLYTEKAAGLLDAERYMMLEKPIQQEISEVERRAVEFFGQNGFAMIAFGSAVGDEPLEASDIDIMLVAADPAKFTVNTAQMKASLSLFSYNEIDDRWQAGDQFVQNTVARGIIVRDPNEKLTKLRISAPRSDATEQTLDAFVKSYKRELELYSRAYKHENWEEAARHRTKLADNLTRQWLLRVKVQPRSRTELAGQLETLCPSLLSIFNDLNKEPTPNKRQAEKRDKLLWRYRSLTSLLSNETAAFRDLVDMLYGNQQEAENAIWTFLLSQEFEVMDNRDARADMTVADPGNGESLTIEVKSLKSGLDKKNIGLHLLNRTAQGENTCLVYNPYRDIPVDERVFDVNPEVEKKAREKGIRLIPSNAFFSKACDLLIGEVSKSTWLETLSGVTSQAVDK